jgi:uncharacterized membrane protein YhaH (DUF805 family)
VEWFFENFSPSGRTNRARYWLYSIAYGVAWAILWVIFFAATAFLMNAGGLGVALVIVLGIALLVGSLPLLFLGIRRLHDREKSGLWIVLFLFAPNIISALSEATADETTSLILALAGIGLSIWAFVELGCLKGTTGPNEFGPDPLEKPTATAAVFE